MYTLNSTHDPKLESWIEYKSDTDFPIQNLPFGVYSPIEGGPTHPCSRIGDFIIDLTILQDAGIFNGPLVGKTQVFKQSNLNAFIALGKDAWSEVRHKLSSLLQKSNPRLQEDEALKQRVLIPIHKIKMHLPVQVGDYTDFYSSKEHAQNVGTMFRGPDNALMPNWTHLPVAYHGRSSSIIVSQEPVQRPYGQVLDAATQEPEFQASRLMDFELEMGCVIGSGNKMQEPIPVQNAEDHIFGLLLVNDWSARDIQKWEYQPLGPFLAKNFATSVAPWIVSLEALEPFRCPGPIQNPEPLPYLQAEGPGTFDIELEVSLQTEKMEQSDTICRSNFKYLYWDMRQQIAHHTITGCNLRPADLLASGTISGPTETSYGSMLELAWKGTKPIQLSNGEERKFLHDGDTVSMTAFCAGQDYRIGFGHVTSKILPAKMPLSLHKETVASV